MILNWIAAIGVIVTSLVSIVNHHRIKEVHVLVNNRLDRALEQIVIRTGERDALQKEKDQSDNSP